MLEPWKAGASPPDATADAYAATSDPSSVTDNPRTAAAVAVAFAPIGLGAELTHIGGVKCALPLCHIALGYFGFRSISTRRLRLPRGRLSTRLRYRKRRACDRKYGGNANASKDFSARYYRLVAAVRALSG